MLATTASATMLNTRLSTTNNLPIGLIVSLPYLVESKNGLEAQERAKTAGKS
jgi:hypothetical protein